MQPTPEDVFALLAEEPGSVWLDGGSASDSWSYLLADPVEVVQVGDDWPATGRRLAKAGQGDEAPFCGGVAGYLGYGAGHRVDRVPQEAPTPEPEVWLGAYEGALAWRPGEDRWRVVGRPSFREKASGWLERASRLPPPAPPPLPTSVRTTPKDAYLTEVRRILAWIHDGDCYQVNLSRPIFADGVGSPFSAWRRLRASSAPAHGAFLRLAPDLAVLSNSPELFLEADGREIASEPIKGTRTRGADPIADEAAREALLTSSKDQAELTMIVDLVRNDLGRVAIAGSVGTGDRLLTPHANVWHTSCRVEALLRDGCDLWSALAATFPPGSVTGAPKIRAAQRIAACEPHPRGVYCGAIGWAGPHRARFSVAIRTAVWHAGNVRFHVGGGIVAGSVPEDEWAETVAKASALTAAFGLPR